jgi:hypothetical protein
MAEPLTKPVASQRTVRRLVKKYADLMGFAHPMRIGVAFYDSRKKQYIDPDDPACYGAAHVMPQYMRAVLCFDLYHEGWALRDESIDECIRHELGHALVALFAQAASHLVKEKDQQTPHILADLEDQLVQVIASMPVWAYVEDE